MPNRLTRVSYTVLMAFMAFVPVFSAASRAAAASDISPAGKAESSVLFAEDRILPLDGSWAFTLDPQNQGEKDGWFQPEFDRAGWRGVTVPHTWQVEPDLTGYQGLAWYAVAVPGDAAEAGQRIRLEFDAVSRDAVVWFNGTELGRHFGSAYTPFRFDVTARWKHDGDNWIVVSADNRFSEKALPYKDSFDWPADGGITRRVRLRVTGPHAVESVRVHTEIQNDFLGAYMEARVEVTSPDIQNCVLQAWIVDPDGRRSPVDSIKPWEETDGGATASIVSPVPHLKFWHFDEPNQYRLEVQLLWDGRPAHQKDAVFGVRKVEVKNGFYYLNGEPMRLMGVEWMPGSDPRYGMSESPEFMHGILRDMKQLNCLLTRFHWQQDDSVFDFCDTEGILVQEEVPAWGGKTMDGDLKDVQRSQTEEMIAAHANHPSIYAWGLCNETGELDRAAEFTKRGAEIARSLDPHRLLTFASNSLQAPNLDTDTRDHASDYVDFIEWNDYYGSWYGGGILDMVRNLERIQKRFPQKTVVISEYGLCECDPKNPSRDEVRMDILKSHTDAYRAAPNVAGAIFFDYNDYRTHIGDKGQGAFQQRVHGVVDLLGRPKPSWEALRRECSPVRSIDLTHLRVNDKRTEMDAVIATRSLENDFPAYTLRKYLLVWTAYNRLGQPLGTGKKVLSEIAPGSHHVEIIDWPTFENLDRIRVELFRPTGYSVTEAKWSAETN